FFFFQAEDGIRVFHVTGVQTCALPILCLLLVVLEWTLSLQWEYFLHYGLVLLIAIALIGRAERARQQKLRREQRSTDEIQQLARSEERRVGKECRGRRETDQ